MHFEVAENEPALEFVAANDAADEQVVRPFVTSAGRLARKRAGLRKDEFVRLDQPLQLLDGSLHPARPACDPAFLGDVTCQRACHATERLHSLRELVGEFLLLTAVLVEEQMQLVERGA